MLNIEEAIASYEKSAERYHKALLHCKAHGGEFYQEEAESNKICYEHDRQLAAWLRELQERRKQPEKAQLSQEGTTSDLISRQEAIDALDCISGVEEVLRSLPTIQPEPAISVAWIDKYIEWLKSFDNEFVNLAAAHISVMVKKWRDEQDETD